MESASELYAANSTSEEHITSTYSSYEDICCDEWGEDFRRNQESREQTLSELDWLNGWGAHDNPSVLMS